MRAFGTALIACLALALVAGSLPVQGQSLAQLAKKEEERRKAIKVPAKVYTNEDLPAVPPATAPALVTEEKSETADAAKDADKAAAPDATKDKAPGDKPALDQAYWRGRMQALETQLNRDETYVDAVQSRINALTTDFVNRDDPAQRAVIARDRDKNLAELDRLKKAILDDKKAINDLQEEARRSGVPPGWLR